MFEPLNGLERLLVSAATDPAERSAFSRALLASEVFLSPSGPPDEDGVVPSLRAVTLPSGETAVALFTAPERLTAAFGDDALVLANTGRAMLEWVRPGPAALNPGAEYGVNWSKDDLEQLLDGRVTQTIQKDTQVLLGHPAEPPTDLIARLTGAFAEEPSIRGAWLLLAFREDEAGQTWWLGLDQEGDGSGAHAAIGRALEGLTLDKPLDVIDVTADAAHTLRTGIVIKALPARTSPPSKKRGLFSFLR